MNNAKRAFAAAALLGAALMLSTPAHAADPVPGYPSQLPPVLSHGGLIGVVTDVVGLTNTGNPELGNAELGNMLPRARG